MTALSLLKPGDWLVMALGAGVVAWLSVAPWRGGSAETVIIRSGGTVIAEASLRHDQTFRINGPLGTSLIAIQQRRARVVADPSPRQYCVKQGWLAKPGDTAICLPNQVSIEIAGSRGSYDSLNY